MSRRFLSLYYGSISPSRALRSVWCWTTGFLTTAAVRRESLGQVVRAHLGDVAVFPVGSGRSALAACLKAAGIGAGDEVLLSAYTCLAVPTAVIATGATPIYVDISEATLNAEAEAVLAAISPRVRAVVVQHTLGKVAPIQAILEGARTRGILVIEDCALALGSRIDGRYVGTFGDAAIFSMELSKTLSCGWGGLLVVNSHDLSVSMAKFYATLPEPSWWASARDAWQTAISAWCHHPALFDSVGRYVLAIAFKSRCFRPSTPAPEFEGRTSPRFILKMGGAQAGLAALQWRDLNKVASVCEAHGRQLRRALGELGFTTPGNPADGEVSVAPRVSFLVSSRQDAMAYFGAKGIDLGQWFDGPLSPVPSSPLFNYKAGSYPVAEKVALSVVNLPSHSRISASDLAHMVAALQDYAREHPGCALRDSPSAAPVARFTTSSAHAAQ